MSVFKEGYHAVESIRRNSRQLYSDAADYGAPVKRGDNLWNEVKQAVEWYGVPGTRKQIDYGTGTTVEQVIELMDEWNTGAIECFKIVYITVPHSDYDGYFEVYKAQ